MMKPLPEQKACPHIWAPRPGGFRYECDTCGAWGRKIFWRPGERAAPLPGGQIVMYPDGGRSGLDDEQRARLDDLEAEADRALLEEIRREDEDWG